MICRLQQTSQFRKDCKRMKRRGLNLEDLTGIIEMLQDALLRFFIRFHLAISALCTFIPTEDHL